MSARKCHACFSVENVAIHPELYGDTLCAPCAAALALDDAAAAHLVALLRPVVQDWARHWQAVGVTPSALIATLEIVGHSWDSAGASGENPGAAALIQSALATR